MQSEEIKKRIEDGIPNASAYVEGDGTHFSVLVICSSFVGKSRIQKQQLVYDTVRKELMDGSLHALSVKALTPEEWKIIEKDMDQE